ncbi:MAG: hypothetical protein AAGB13_19435 [Cyanobacteria bacterium P01_F01_bin.33]
MSKTTPAVRTGTIEEWVLGLTLEMISGASTSLSFVDSGSSFALADDLATDGIYHPDGPIAGSTELLSFEYDYMVAVFPTSAPGILQHATATRPIMAQQYDQDVMGDIAKGWNSFVDSGQIWALLGGVVLGYLLRSITS